MRRIFKSVYKSETENLSEWELINKDSESNTYRMDIPEGYLYKTIVRGSSKGRPSISIVFVPSKVIKYCTAIRDPS